MTRSHPRQIATEIIRELAELTAGMPALRRRRWPSGNRGWKHTFPEALHSAFLMGTRPPRLPGRRPGWFAISAAAWHCAEVIAFARAGDTAPAWRAAADAEYWHGVAEGFLGATALSIKEAELEKQMKAATDACLRKARDAKAKVAIERAGCDWRECARKIAAGNDPATGRPWKTREKAKAYIGERFNKSRSAVDRALGAERRSASDAMTL